MTTHAPSTVAIAPDDAIYAMENSPPNLRKMTKKSAIDQLTHGVPTLSIDFSGRIQVFVESYSDSIIYDRVYQAIKTLLNSEKSLEFIPTGRQKETGTEVDAGCTRVRDLVQRLSEAGVATIAGLIDWDKSNVSADRIVVLAEGTRYSIENCIYDPLLLAAVIANDAPESRGHIGLSDSEVYSGFGNLSHDRLQSIANRVQTNILQVSEDDLETDSIGCSYGGGSEICISRRYLEMKGHDLEKLILEHFGELRKFTDSQERLMRRVVETAITNFPDMIPNEIVQSFRKLLEI